MTPRQHDARSLRALVVLAIALPAVTALSFAQDAPTALAPSTTPTRMVGEQVGTAREIIPFGAGRDGDDVVTWAVGQTRAPSPEPPSTPTTPAVVQPTGPPPPDESSGMAVLDGVKAQARRAALSLAPDVNVLLVGTAAKAQGPSAWKRTAPPLGADGDALVAGSWRPAGPAAPSPTTPAGTTPAPASRAAFASPHAGESTPNGAAALLVRLDGATASSGLLARREDGRFQLLPKPPTELLAPATEISNPEATADLSPLAAIDADPPSPADATTPSAPTTYGRTGVLIVPPGGDGVLAWDGAAWTKEPFQDATGVPAAPARTPVALAATPDGDAVALVTDEDGTSANRVTLYRRLADHSGWRPMELEAPLLSGALPSGVDAVTPTERPGDPLTVARGHWWVDVIVRRTSGASVPATVHLTPGPARAAATTPAPTATAPTTTDPADPTSTSPEPSTPAETTPAASTPPTTATTPLSPLQARSTGVWCVAQTVSDPATAALPGDLCTAELPGGFPTGRGYRSQAFATQGELPSGAAPTTPSSASPFGGRVITSPVVEPDAGPDPDPVPEPDPVKSAAKEAALRTAREAARDASASGGYLRLDGTKFTLRGGMGETADAKGHTEAAAFLSDRLGWTGGARLIGHVVAASAFTAGTYTGTTPRQVYDLPIDILVSPPSVPKEDAGAVTLQTGYVRRDFDDGRTPNYSGFDLYRLLEQPGRSAQAAAWYARDSVAIVGTNGLLTKLAPPTPNSDQPYFDGDQDRPGSIKLINNPNMNLTDVAFSSTTLASNDGPAEGWAVGRDGAALQLTSADKTATAELEAKVVKLAEPLVGADLRQVAYAGDTAYVASSRGPLVAKDGTFVIDTNLAAMIEADGRRPDVRSVAGLPDGAVVFDGRYARNSASEPWQRLPSPAEGDVIALGLARPSGEPGGGLSSLRIQASIADRAKPRVGEIVSSGSSPGPNDDYVEGFAELTSLAPDGRLTELTPAGWVDRTRTPIDLEGRLDLPAPNIPIQAISLQPDGTGWAAGGTGSYRGQYNTPISVPRATVWRVDDSVLDGPASGGDQPSEATPAPAAALGRRAARSQQRQLPAPTTIDPAPTTTPLPTTAPDGPGIAAVTPDSKPIKLLIGGHPSCLDECTGREEQSLAPLEAIRQAFVASRAMRSEGVGAVIIGGGRTSANGPGLSRAAAQSYADLLRSDPGTPPVFAAIGTGDTRAHGKPSPDSRTAFTNYVVSALQPAPASDASPAAPRTVVLPGRPTPAGGDFAAAYAFDVPGESGGAARVIVIDNAGGALRSAERQAQWLTAMLDDARTRGRAAVVVGAAPVDRDVTDARAAAELIALLSEGRAAAYVSTDGEDDPQSPRFGLHERADTVGPAALPVFHTSALGHALPQPVRSAIPSDQIYDPKDGSLVQTGPLGDSSEGGAALLQLTVPADVMTPKSGGNGGPEMLDDVDGQTVPVFHDFAEPEQSAAIVGDAAPLFVPTAIDADNGTRWTDPNDVAAGGQPSWGSGGGYATPYPCRLWYPRSECDQSLSRSGVFTSSDPSVAIFVRARLSGKDPKTRRPSVVVDPATGNPVQDSASSVLCPLKAGSTVVTLTVAGRTTSWNFRVVNPPQGYKPAAPEGHCELWNSRPAEPPATKPEAAVPPVPGVLKPVAPVPSPSPPAKPSPTDQPQAPLARPLPLATGLLGVPTIAQPSAAPPVAPNPKPVSPPAPIPPSGVTHSYSQVASPSVVSQTVAAQQAERRKEVAQEGADHQATIYRAAPRSDVTLALAGGALALLIAALGHTAGRRRAIARAATRRFLR